MLKNMKRRIVDAPRWHERIMSRYLRRRGWVVFFLEPQYRLCAGHHEVCWMREYERIFPDYR